MRKLQELAEIFLAIDVHSFFDLCQMFQLPYVLLPLSPMV